MKIEIKNLKKYYDDEIILNDINVEIDKVEAVVLLGISGSGKSTLLRLLSGMETGYEGSIKINGESVNTREFKDKIGFVFQTGSLFPHLSLIDNIVLILHKIKKIPKDEALKTVLDLLERFSLIEHKDKYPHQLSGGQQQRASIVRSLALGAEIFFFDEPTSALDPILTNEVLDTIKELRALGKSFIIVTHEIAFARQSSDYVIFLQNSEIKEQGDISLLQNPKSREFQDFLNKVLLNHTI